MYGYGDDFKGHVSVSPVLSATETLFLNSFVVSEHDDGPSPRCHWMPTPYGTGLMWDGEGEFREPEAWMRYIINHFLKPDAHRARLPGYAGFGFDHIVNGVILARNPDESWVINVLDNDVVSFPSA